ncbi:flagellar type III secretion system pore protein FliP [Buchnera aphidicola (Mindarus keteleerifoliae)]|uniref:flagellar type III secretion system pore protein FliP n=1 Tax=Buchnera aphidicola TaxID=9 RepID=UPI0031B6F1A2
MLKKNNYFFFKKTNIFQLFCFFPCFISSTAYGNTQSSFFNDILNNKYEYFPSSLKTFILIALLTFLPAFLLMMTSFTRIIIVFSLLRNALGIPNSPSNQIIVGLSLFLTFFIMSPVLNESYKIGYVPFSENKITIKETIEKSINPFKKFMLNQVKESDLIAFSNLSHEFTFQKKIDVPMNILLPSFIISELKAAFQIGFTIFIPFLIVDLVVASVLMSLGMMMVPPSTISLPLKLMLFVLVDGWQLLVFSLSNSFHI